MRIIAFWSFAIAGASCATTTVPQVPAAYIVPAERGTEFYRSREKQTYWTPSRRQIDDLERALPGFLRTEDARSRDHDLWPPIEPRLRHYGRQYVGLVRDGRRIIWVNAFIMDGVIPPEHASKQGIRTNEGGNRFWRVDYDPASGTFANFHTNGLM